MNTDILYIASPITIGFIVSMICSPDSKSGSTVKFRPPPWVFSVVWSILYLMIGYAWVNSKSTSIYFIILLILLDTWLITYSCIGNKNISLLVLVLSLLSTMLVYTTAITTISKILITPLFIWLLYALMISTAEIQNQ